MSRGPGEGSRSERDSPVTEAQTSNINITRLARDGRTLEVSAATDTKEKSKGGSEADRDDQQSSRDEGLREEASRKLDQKKVVLDKLGQFKVVLEGLSKIGEIVQDVSSLDVDSRLPLIRTCIRSILPSASSSES